jgi:putative ubiquitin-RnfH superfamily antitoxin RatB of RatAB toxin-antitoxin module
MAPAEPAALRVSVVFCPAPGSVDEVVLEVPPGTTIQQAFVRSGLAARHPGCETLPLGLWGRVRPAATPLREGDRVEVYRPLTVDPKEARRQRYRGQKATRKPRRDRCPAFSARSRRR